MNPEHADSTPPTSAVARTRPDAGAVASIVKAPEPLACPDPTGVVTHWSSVKIWIVAPAGQVPWTVMCPFAGPTVTVVMMGTVCPFRPKQAPMSRLQ